MQNKFTGNILVVDDQDNWRRVLNCLLTEEGHVVTTFAHFAEAEEAISHGTFDLVILDLRLVDENVFDVQGLELLQLAKKKEVAPRVILLTGYPESLREGVPERLGADCTFLKVPLGSCFNINDFKEKVRILLQSKN